MEEDRSSVIELGGKTYELLLTTRATKEIAKRYGGLSALGDKLLQEENFELALDEIIWLITLLANQPIYIHNLRNPNDVQVPLTEEYLELLTTPVDLAGYRGAIMEALVKGTQRNILSEEDAKNAVAP